MAYRILFGIFVLVGLGACQLKIRGVSELGALCRASQNPDLADCHIRYKETDVDGDSYLVEGQFECVAPLKRGYFGVSGVVESLALKTDGSCDVTYPQAVRCEVVEENGAF